MNSSTLLPNESISLSLRELYSSYGYSRYKMNKFEEYDLYAKNKDFLISDNVITFTDTTGRLLALKPDVTLSIVKNTQDESNVIQKLYYTESVYRVSKGTHSYKEITQVGLEAIGDIDEYCIYEVLKLAAESLLKTNQNCILEISHLGLLDELLDFSGIPIIERNRIVQCIGEKNIHELEQICVKLGIATEKINLLTQTASLYGSPDEVLKHVLKMFADIPNSVFLDEFVRVINALNASKYQNMIRIDFSAVSDLRYYNGFVFKGFAESIPSAVLSGGQYDKMMQKMKRQSGAIGFAVYLDVLEQYTHTSPEFDVDILLVYDSSCSITEIEKEAKRLTAIGKSIMVQHYNPKGLRCRQIIQMSKGRAEE